ncbi:MAG: hypothetical protein KF799_11790 [Bdellovibrionales bacterium]|nr:hypothetical protein [Bdellovibrionales bacterium]
MRPLLHFIMLTLAALSAPVKAADADLYSLLVETPDLHGFFVEHGLFREMRLVSDGDNLRLQRAGLTSLVFDAIPSQAQISRHPNGTWRVYVLRWVLPNSTILEMVFRPDKALEFEAKTEFKGMVQSVPRIHVSLMDGSKENTQPNFGSLATIDQAGVLPAMLKVFERARVNYLSFEEADRQECEQALQANLIRTRR